MWLGRWIDNNSRVNIDEYQIFQFVIQKPVKIAFLLHLLLKKTPLNYYRTIVEKIEEEKILQGRIDELITLVALSPERNNKLEKERKVGFGMLFRHPFIYDQFNSTYRKTGLLQLGPILFQATNAGKISFLWDVLSQSVQSKKKYEAPKILVNKTRIYNLFEFYLDITIIALPSLANMQQSKMIDFVTDGYSQNIIRNAIHNMPHLLTYDEFIQFFELHEITLLLDRDSIKELITQELRKVNHKREPMKRRVTFKV